MSTLQAVLAILATAFISQTWSAKAGDDLNPWLLNAEYAVRGEVPVRAAQLKARLAKGKTRLRIGIAVGIIFGIADGTITRHV